MNARRTRLGILGVGKMGEAIVRGIQNSGANSRFEPMGTVRDPQNAKRLTQELGFPVHTDNAKLVKECDVLILCVKPHQAPALLQSQSVQDALRPDQLLISICASLTCADLEAWVSPKLALLRAMPNTPCLIGEGMTVFAKGANVTDAHLEIAETLFRSIGETATVEESLMDGVTGLSGCGPAYVYLMIEALSEAGVKVGLSRKLSTLLAAQTLKGAAQMVLERNDLHPAAMKDEVTTPAGCTIDGLMALEEGKLRVTLIKGVLAATRRSRLMRKRGSS